MLMNIFKDWYPYYTCQQQTHQLTVAHILTALPTSTEGSVFSKSKEQI